MRAAALALAATAFVCSAAAAASPPTVSTGAAREVSYGSAVLTGSVKPNGADASYYFQFGLTKAYGGQTAIADAGAGVHAVKVSLPVTGLQPLTVYHYRLVAVSSAGASIGRDGTLLTTKVPLSLQILASPNPVLFGGSVAVQGTLSGTGNGSRAVILQASSFPFTAGFQNLGNPELTNASGGFSFPVLGMTLVTQFRVVTTTNPPVVSPVALDGVAVRVGSHVARTSRDRGPGRERHADRDPQDHAWPWSAGWRGASAPAQRRQLKVQPRRARQAGRIPGARARHERRADLQLRPAPADRMSR
jgi:hypothetical protein